MCSSHQPEAGADSTGEVVLFEYGSGEPVPVQCGHWVERDFLMGFCMLVPGHYGECEPPSYGPFEAWGQES